MTTDFARSLRKSQTDAEKMLWLQLRDRRLDGYKFRRQQTIGKYVVDFVCLDPKLIIELDGGHHAEQKEYDSVRAEFLERTGYRVLRFWDDDVLKNTEAVLQVIHSEVTTPSPQPSPGGRGGETQEPRQEVALSAFPPLPPGEGRGEGGIGAKHSTLTLRNLSTRDYTETWHAMQRFTTQRTTSTPDELWLVEHPPVYTQGLNGKPEHLLNPGDIPVIQTDRGGQVTYHGPGQLVAYILMDLRRRNWGVRDLVTALEESVIALLREYGIESHARRDAPGVYVSGAKIAALGLRVKRGCSYHGLSLNANMNLEPFARINPCGYSGLEVTQLAALGAPCDLDSVANALVRHLTARLGYNNVHFSS